MAKKKLKIYAKEIERLPHLHKQLAAFVAKVTLALDGVTADKLIEIYSYGHRGFYAYDEKDLTSKFDKLYQVLTDKEKEPSLKGWNLFPHKNKWEVSRDIKGSKKTFTLKEELVEEADQLFHDIFEKIFFMQEIKSKGRKP